MEATSPRRERDRVEVGRVVNETLSIYGQNFLVLIGSAIAVFLVVGIVAGLLESEGGFFLLLLAAIVRLVGFGLYAGFVVKLVSDARDGRRDETIGELFSSAAPAIGALIAFAILFGIGVGIGFVLLIIPGLILLTFWCVGAPAIVVERVGPIEAFGRSWNLVRGDAWSVFATLVVIALIVIAIGIVLGIIGTAISDGAILAASIISNILTAPIFAIAVSVIFFDLGGGGGPTTAAPAAPAEPPPPPTAPTA